MSKVTKVDEANYGIYVWNVTGLGILGDTDGNVLRVNSYRNDLSKIKAIRDAATSLGYPDGVAEFWSGVRAISDSEWEDQMARTMDGEVGDPYDIPALIDQMKADNGIE